VILVHRHGSSHNYTLTVSVQAGTAPVVKVDFYVGTTLMATATSTTGVYSATVAVKQSGIVPIRAVASDTAGRTSELHGEIVR
jgi:hypothetical protein